jgi:uncharacterized protein (DUF433 family)
MRLSGTDTMSNRLNQEDRDILERLAGQKMKPTKRQKAVALLDFVEGVPLEKISEHVGISKGELEGILEQFQKYGLSGVGLAKSQSLPKEDIPQVRHGTIESTPDVCGGSARIAGTRVPVWVLVEARDLGVSEAQLLIDYPALRAVNLVDAWNYASLYSKQIDAEIHRNEVA